MSTLHLDSEVRYQNINPCNTHVKTKKWAKATLPSTCQLCARPHDKGHAVSTCQLVYAVAMLLYSRSGLHKVGVQGKENFLEVFSSCWAVLDTDWLSTCQARVSYNVIKINKNSLLWRLHRVPNANSPESLVFYVNAILKRFFRLIYFTCMCSVYKYTHAQCACLAPTEVSGDTWIL